MRGIFEKLNIIWLAVFFIAMFDGSVWAWDGTRDLEGSQDIPGLPRFEGTIISGYRLERFNQAYFPLGKWIPDKGWEKTVKKMGRRTRIIYIAPKDRSSLEIILNYKQMLKEMGYETMLECSGFQECGEKVGDFYRSNKYGDQLTDHQLQACAFSSVKEPQIFAGKAMVEGKESYVFIFAAYQNNYSAYARGAKNRVAVFVQEVRTEPMENKMVTIQAEKLDNLIKARGRVAIYGIYFDRDKAVVKPESRPQIEEMANFLKQRPNLGVYIVGHTDSQGTEAHNMDLSQRRSQSVVAMLTDDFGIAADRLYPRGVASLAPVTSNNSEQGRAKNRRVEMVQK